MYPVTNPFHWDISGFFCSDLIDIREHYFNVDSLKVLFKDVSSNIIFNFLKDINIFYKLFVFGKEYTFVFDFEFFQSMTE